jgi:hypothetical protein
VFRVESIEMIREYELLGRLLTGFPLLRLGFDPRSGHVKFVMGKVALGQIFFGYVGVPCQFRLQKPFHIRHQPLTVAIESRC